MNNRLSAKISPSQTISERKSVPNIQRRSQGGAEGAQDPP